jgi:hypothetical protein
MHISRQSIVRVLCAIAMRGLGTMVIATLAGSSAWAQNSLLLPDFSATEITHVRGREIASKIYHSGPNFRVEPAPGVATIYLAPQNMIYKLMFNGSQCIAFKDIDAHSVSSPLQLLSGAKVEHKADGTEVFDGHACHIDHMTVTTADGRTTLLTLWEAADLKGVPVKIEMHSERGSLTTTYRDIALGAPDPALFAPPRNCKPFEKTYQIAPPEK